MSQPESSLSRSLRQLLLWLPVLALLLGLIYWDLPAMQSEPVSARFTGNATNLFAVAVPEPVDGGGEVFTFRRLDPRGQWLPEEQGPGRPVALAAWQEDLVVQFESGGLFFFGPSNVYRSPPVQPWRPVALASDDSTLMALGVTRQGRVVFSRRGVQDWGEVETVPVDLAPQEDRAAAKLRAAERVVETARAAVAGGWFHVIWQTQVPGAPIGTNESRWLLHHVWRDGQGQWSYDSLPQIHAREQIGVSSADGRLIMVYVEAEGPPRVRRAQFVPETARWHVLNEVDLSAAAGDDETPPAAGVGLTTFRDQLMLVLKDEESGIHLMAMDLEEGSVSSVMAAPELTVPRPVVADRPTTMRDVALLAIPGAIGLAVLMFTWSRERRTLVRQVAEGRLTAEEAARQAGMSQVQRLSYLPILLRRIVALVIDMMLVGLLSLAVLSWWLNIDIMVFVQQESFLNDIRHMMYWQLLATGLMTVYGFVSETIWRRTVGKRLLGLCVTSLSGGRAAWHQILVRNLLRPLDMSIRGAVGLFLVLWSPRNQRIGDVAGDTRVDLNRPPSPQ